MTNRLAIILWLLIAGAFALDVLVLHSGATFFLLKKFDALIEWLAFWR